MQCSVLPKKRSSSTYRVIESKRDIVELVENGEEVRWVAFFGYGGQVEVRVALETVEPQMAELGRPLPHCQTGLDGGSECSNI